jgi:hypothetical protein
LFQFRQFYRISCEDGNIVELDGSEIHSQSLFSFYTPPTVQSQFSVQRSSAFKKQSINFIKMYFYSNDMYIYKRTYKTFNSAFATSFALFKLFNGIVSIILSRIYTYYMNTIIINNNFDYQLSTTDKHASCEAECPKSKELLSNELTSIKTKQLTAFLALKNVSLVRYLYCRKRNRTKTFYENAKYVIYKHLSVENLFFYLIEYFKMNKFILTKYRDYESSYSSKFNKLILNNNQENTTKEEDLQLDALINNLRLYESS